MYNGFMELAWTCKHCRSVNMVDMNSLFGRPAGKLLTEHGYFCANCLLFNRLYLSTRSLDDAIQKLKSVRVTHPKFQFFFAKTLRKALGVQKWPDRK